MVLCSPLPVRPPRPGPCVEGMPLPAEGISARPPPFAADRFGRDGAVRARLKKLLLSVPVPSYALALAAPCPAGLEDAARSRSGWVPMGWGPVPPVKRVQPRWLSRASGH